MSDDGSSLAYQRSMASSPVESLPGDMDLSPSYTAEYGAGMRAAVQQLYRPDDRSAWQEITAAPEPTAAGEAEAGSYAQECALVVRREATEPGAGRSGSGSGTTTLHSVTVQSPLIRQALHGVFAGFAGLSTQLRQLVFKAPFHPVYYRWHRLERARSAAVEPQPHQLQPQSHDSTPTLRQHLDLLHAVLAPEITPHVDAMADMLAHGVVSFEALWTVFAPGVMLYTRAHGGHDCVVELVDGRYGANMGGEHFALEYRYVDCDGAAFGYVAGSLEMEKFDGIRRVADLAAFPVHLHPDVEGLVDRLHRRGQRLEELNGFHHVEYSGFYTARSARQVRKRHVENNRIIIDPHTYNLYSTPGPGLGMIEDSVSSDDDNSTDGDLFAGTYGVMYQATMPAFKRFQKALRKYGKSGKDSNKDLTVTQRLLCTPLIRGYCLTFKTWAEFYVENVSPVRWNDNAFPRLVLPHGYKEIIRAFVQEQLSRDDGFDDIVYGKGLGFIMLLSGEPGVGKTLTAESVAEEMRQPLYLMSASELGETATEVEESLEQVLELTSKWNAILLLDECDMFLEARNSVDLRRNRLVSVFLRQLEYYRGVMFLTSNRIGDFDPAFESRIHLTIHYPSLDLPSRLHIWKTFTQMGDVDSRLGDRELDSLAKIEMNGRQIKNTIKTARLLSKQESAPLAMSHVEMVLKVKKGTFL